MSRAIGAQKESDACLYLQQQGLTLVQTNFHTRYGEIDLIMREGDTWVCVEVKYRSANQYGGALDTVTPAKLSKLRMAFEQFVIGKGLSPVTTPMRIDVVALDGSALQWLKCVD
ncbi:YraN family protein [Alteromonas aestuariivivens]|uniref:UPF0102 protein DXV75_00580 n=1 Tax=Alteromonas aestuariivivens TaxID=1938339 RepID=A0A3D8MFL4_9ALTE|nr:YraN family protein [Alteromonas aestuariivivens]RDV28998.1 YraN family protein [Alteromonas aestuariivivens]